MAEPDPYMVLGISPEAAEAEVRTAYRRGAQQLHPDHNGGSPEAARRFAELHAAYVAILEDRRTRTRTRSHLGDPLAEPSAIDARMAAIEQELREARAAREAADARAAEAARAARPTPEELGYVTSDDSLTKILDDAGAEIGRRLGRWFGDGPG